MATGTRNRNKLNGEKANEPMTASNDDDYCVLESIDGARIMKINDAKALIETIVVSSNSTYTVHFAGQKSYAEIIQKKLESKLENNREIKDGYKRKFI
jgi:hypothetical protein